MARKKAKKTRKAARTAPNVWRKAFLAALAGHGNKTAAAKHARVARSTLYAARDTDPRFKAAWDEALDEAADVLEREAVRRATEGTVRKKFTAKGKPIIDPATGEQYVELEYSDTLLIFLLKGARPEKYRERHQVSHDGQVGQVHFFLPDNGRDQAAAGAAA
jgi:hypothetical protein